MDNLSPLPDKKFHDKLAAKSFLGNKKDRAENTSKIVKKLDQLKPEPRPEVQKVELTNKSNDVGAAIFSMLKGEKGDQGEKGEKGDQGIEGPKGEKGDIGKDGKSGKNGKDGKDGKKGLDGKDGHDGVDGKNGKDAQIGDVVKALSTLTGRKRIPMEAISSDDFVKSVDSNIQKIHESVSFLPRTLHALYDVNMKGLADGNTIIYSIAQRKFIPGTASGAVSSLTTTGTTGPATLVNGVLNIPEYSGGSGSVTWDAIGNPVANQALSMGAFTTGWTYGATTGTSVNPFSVTDSAGNTGTGNLVQFNTASGSTLNPFAAFAQGSVNGINLLANGQLVLSPVVALSQAGVLVTTAPITSGGTGTTTKPVFYLDSGATEPISWSVSGTILGINAPSGFAGSLIDVRVNGGASVFNANQFGISTNSVTATNAAFNLYIPSSNGSAATAQAGLQFASSTTVTLRTSTGATSSTALPANGANFGGFVVGSTPVTIIASGTNPWFANAVINSLGTITAAGGTLTNTTTLYVGPAATAGTNNYGIYSAGNFAVAANGALSNAAVQLLGSPITGGTGTTTFPLIYANGGSAPSTWNTSGTYFGINAVSGFGGNFLDMHVNGAGTVFKVDSTGSIYTTSSATIGSSSNLNAALGVTGTVTTGVTSSASGRIFQVAAGTLTRSADTGTITQSAASSFGIPTLVSGNAGTIYTNASTLYIAGPPVASTNVTITNAWGLYLDNSANAFIGGALTLGTPLSTANGGTGSATQNFVDLTTNQTAAGNKTWSGEAIFTAAGALSTPGVSFTGTPVTSGGTGTTTFPLVYINSGAGPTGFNTAGTMFGINAPSGFTGNLVDFHLNGGGSLFSVGANGTTTVPSLAATAGIIANNAAFNLYIPSSNGSATTTQAGLLFGGSSSVTVRTSTGATTTSAAPATGVNFGNFIVGSTPSSIVATGSNTWFANAVINPLGTITALGAGTLTNSATLYVGAATAGATNSYALYVNGSASYAGSSSGVFTEKAAAATTSYTITWPAAQGAGYLTNDGSGNLSFTAVTSQPGILATITGINAKTVAGTLVYTVPVGKTLTITQAIINATAATAITNGPTAGFGQTSSTYDIYASTAINALTTTGQVFGYTTTGMSVSVASGGTVYFNIGNGASGTSETVTVTLIGFLQ